MRFSGFPGRFYLLWPSLGYVVITNSVDGTQIGNENCILPGRTNLRCFRLSSLKTGRFTVLAAFEGIFYEKKTEGKLATLVHARHH